MPEVSPSVLVIRLDAIGDALALTPALASLRNHAIPFDIVLSAVNAGIFVPTVARETFIADFDLRSSGSANLDAIARFGTRLRRNGYTHAIVATEDPSGYRLAAATGAPVRIGFTDAWIKPLKALWTRRLLTMPMHRSARLRNDEHECQTLFRLVTRLTGDSTPTRDTAELRPLILDSLPVPDDRPALQLTDKWARLGIARDAVVRLVRHMNAAGPLRVIAAQAEKAYAEETARDAGVRVDYFDDVHDWKAALARARVVVAPDSGAIHLAGMIGTPVVAVFAPQRAFDAQVTRWSPWASPHRIVRAEDDWPLLAAQAAADLQT